MEDFFLTMEDFFLSMEDFFFPWKIFLTMDDFFLSMDKIFSYHGGFFSFHGKFFLTMEYFSYKNHFVDSNDMVNIWEPRRGADGSRSGGWCLVGV